MADISKISPDDGSTILNIKDNNAVHWNQAEGYVGKNLLKNIGTNITIRNVTFSVNADKSVILNGTASNDNSNFVIDQFTIPAGTYIVTGTHFGNNNLAFQITDYPITKALFTIFSGDTQVTFAEDTAICVRISMYKNATYNNFVLYPMIRFASITDSTYEPYAMPNTELTKICNPAIYKDITTEVRNKLGTITYTINQACIFETEQKVDLDIWVVGISAGNIDWDLTGVIPKSRGRKGGVIAPRDGNPAGLTWMNNNEAILCNRFSTPVDNTKEYLVTISYFK